MFRVGEMVRIKDIRNRPDYPDRMRMMSGQVGYVAKVTKVVRLDSGGLSFFYELNIDNGLGVWPEDFLEPVKSEQDDQEWIEMILKLIAEIEGKLDQLKRMLWRKKHYGDR